ncbi:TPA: cysteine methyltransferase [bacterium]|nr:cysteine methyltransferase [bacterium]
MGKLQRGMGIKENKDLKLRYTIFRTRYGLFGLVGGLKGLRTLIFPSRGLERKIRERFRKNLLFDPAFFRKIPQKIEAYLEGERLVFDSRVDLRDLSDFQCKVLWITLKIPYGETRSYKWIAEKMDIKGFRAIGSALKRNPLPIVVPCHRVIKSDGSLGDYSSGRGWKERLLRIEGCAITS